MIEEYEALRKQIAVVSDQISELTERRRELDTQRHAVASEIVSNRLNVRPGTVLLDPQGNAGEFVRWTPLSVDAVNGTSRMPYAIVRKLRKDGTPSTREQTFYFWQKRED